MYQPSRPWLPPNPSMTMSLGVKSGAMRFVKRKNKNGSTKITPIKRPKTRCRYSYMKMGLNSSRVIVKLVFWYSGYCWYLRNISCQSARDKGGITPTRGFHSTIDKPELVRRVIPPSRIMPKITVAHISNQYAI